MKSAPRGADRVVTLKATGYWRNTRYKGSPVVVTPEGLVFFGTAQEVRDLCLSPWARNRLASSLKIWRLVHCGDFGKMKAAAADARREVIWLSRCIDKEMSISIPASVYVRMVASARYRGETVKEWFERWMEAAFEVEIDDIGSDTGKREFQFTSKESAFVRRNFKDERFDGFCWGDAFDKVKKMI